MGTATDIETVANTQHAEAKRKPRKAIRNYAYKRKVLIGLFTLLILIALTIFILSYKYIFSLYEKTDDAYVSGNLVYVTPHVSGRVIAIHADNTDLVKAGDVLVTIDDTDFTITLDRRSAELANTVRQLRQLYDKAAQYTAIISGKRVELEQREAEYFRRKSLIQSKVISREDYDSAKFSYESARSTLESTLAEAKGIYALTDNVTLEQHPLVLQAKNNYLDAWLNLQHTSVHAPVTGYIAQRKVQLGIAVNAGATLMAVVPLDEVWVDANFKETELNNIRIGQPVKITSDIYGSQTEYHGKVAGISAGTGSAFALLPPQNASGNWIKIVQRVPVKIVLDKAELMKKPLLLGMSVTAKVDTRNQTGALLADTPVEKANTASTFKIPIQPAEDAVRQIISQNDRSVAPHHETVPVAEP